MNETRKVLVWDAPVRLFHFLFAAGFVAAWAISRLAGEHNPLFPWHMMIGLALAFLVLARAAWGLIGPKWARFSGLSLHPKALMEHFKSAFSKDGAGHAGHNPATSVLLILFMAAAVGMAVTGVQMAGGAEDLKELHELLANVMLALAVVHVAGVLLHSFVKEENISAGMVHGRKQADQADSIAGHYGAAAGAMLLMAGWFFGSMALQYDPARGQTKWPLTGAILPLSEEAGERGEQSGRHGEAGESRESRESREGEEREHEEHGE